MKYCDVTAVILCAGSGERAGLGYNKMLYVLPNGKTVLDTVLEKFADFENIILVHSTLDSEAFDKYPHEMVIGGNTRGGSVLNALKRVTTPLVCIHDGARPYVSSEVIADSVEKARATGCGVACVKEINSLKKLEGEYAISVNRDEYFEVQTPQSFDCAKLLSCYEKVGTDCTDDSAVWERGGERVVLSCGDYSNKKLTSHSDFAPENFKIGYGFDVHALVENRKLIIGGIEIEHYKGLLGHSDADVLVHAIMDAILSACGKKDIGNLFPDTDPAYKNADSCKLLERVMEAVKPHKIVNVSAVIMAQKPKMSPHVLSMRTRLAPILGIDVEDINISATTTEKLGICGEEKGIAAAATVLVSR